MGKITVEVQKNTFGTPLYSLSHPNVDGIYCLQFDQKNIYVLTNFSVIVVPILNYIVHKF